MAAGALWAAPRGLPLVADVAQLLQAAGPLTAFTFDEVRARVAQRAPLLREYERLLMGAAVAHFRGPPAGLVFDTASAPWRALVAAVRAAEQRGVRSAPLPATGSAPPPPQGPQPLPPQHPPLPPQQQSQLQPRRAKECTPAPKAAVCAQPVPLEVAPTPPTREKALARAPPPPPPTTAHKASRRRRRVAGAEAAGPCTLGRAWKVRRRRRHDSDDSGSGDSASSSDHRSSRRQWSDEHEHDDLCHRCRDGGRLLLCDGCPRVYHLRCLRPPLHDLPRGMWFCAACEQAPLVPSCTHKRNGKLGQFSALVQRGVDEEDGAADSASERGTTAAHSAGREERQR